MSEIKIAADSRTEFGKGAARRTRRAGQVPAVLYGHGTDPVHLSLPGHEHAAGAARRQRRCWRSPSTAPRPSWPCPSRCSATRSAATIEHVDLVIVRKGEKVTVEVAAGRRRRASPADRMVLMDQQTHRPRGRGHPHPDLDRDRRRPASRSATRIAAKDLKLPEGAVFPGEPDDLDAVGRPRPRARRRWTPSSPATPRSRRRDRGSGRGGLSRSHVHLAGGRAR